MHSAPQPPLSRWLYPALFLLAILPFTSTAGPRITTLLLTFGYAVWQWRQRPVPPLPFKLAFASWLAIPILFLPFALDPAYSIKEIKTEVVFGLVAFFSFFVLTDSRRMLRGWFTAVAIGATVISLWGIADFAIHGMWYEPGHHGGSASFVTYAITVAPLALPAWILFSDQAGRARKIVALVVSVLILAALLTGQRIAEPVLFAQLIAVMAWAGQRKLLAWRTTALVAAALTLVIGIGGALMVEHRFGGVEGIRQSIENDPRIDKLHLVTGTIAERPWTGFGFGRNAMKLARPQLMGHPADQFWHAHNTLLNYWIEVGLPGMAALLFLFGTLFAAYLRLARHDDPLLSAIGIAGLTMVLGVVLRNQVNDMFQRDLSLLFWCVNGFLFGFALRRKGEIEPTRPTEPTASTHAPG